MTVELLVTVQVPGPEVPDTHAEEERIEAGAVKLVERAIAELQQDRSVTIKLIGVELAAEVWADAEIARANKTAL